MDEVSKYILVGIIQFSMQIKLNISFIFEIFKKYWNVIIRFVLAWCERGRGLRPDWAVKGMEFLYLAASPTYTRYLTECEFLG